MITAYFLIDAAGWTWIIVIAVLLVGGYFFIDRLMRKGNLRGQSWWRHDGQDGQRSVRVANAG